MLFLFTVDTFFLFFAAVHLSGQHCRLYGQPVGDLLPGECRGHSGPECSLPGAAQGLGETLFPELISFVKLPKNKKYSGFFFLIYIFRGIQQIYHI